MITVPVDLSFQCILIDLLISGSIRIKIFTDKILEGTIVWNTGEFLVRKYQWKVVDIWAMEDNHKNLATKNG